MTGFVSGAPLAQLYSHAGVFVIPSYHEGLPIALLEAMSYGLSVLASDIPANRQAGLPEDRFFPPGNTAALAERLAFWAGQLFTPAQKLEQIGFVARHFDWDRIADQTIEVYSGVLQRKV
jgi:glycosyltransferase involved in cell wall biosynthesis